MTWYYLADGEQQGPVSDGELDALLREGEIERSTLVWRAGMSEWQPLTTARPISPPPRIPDLSGNRCAVCGQAFPPNELVKVNRTLICGACKPRFLQSLAEGVSPAGGYGIWRLGKKFVTSSETPFPDRCVKCNAPANGYRLKRVLYWHHPALYLLLLSSLVLCVVGLLLAMIIIAVVQKKAVLHIGLCETHRKQRITAIIACFGGVLGGLVMMFIGGALSIGWLMLFGLALVIFGAVWGITKARTIYPTKINQENVWVTGAGKDFLAELPEWPG